MVVKLFLPAVGAGRLTALGAGAVAVAVMLGSAPQARGGGSGERLTVFAASSLTGAFRAYAPSERFTFAGSGTLQTQIENGAPADVFASASQRNTRALHAKGLVERPVVFATNRLVLIVPRANPAGIRTVADLRRDGVKVVVAGDDVPAGAYAAVVLRRLRLSSALENVVSRERDVKAVAAKVALGQADAGFVYATDARAVADRVRVIDVPARAQPTVRYEIAVVSRSADRRAARAFIAGLLAPRGQAVLRAAGFLPPPKEQS